MARFNKMAHAISHLHLVALLSFINEVTKVQEFWNLPFLRRTPHGQYNANKYREYYFDIGYNTGD